GWGSTPDWEKRGILVSFEAKDPLRLLRWRRRREVGSMTKGLRGALFAPLVAALLLLGAPTATFAAASHQGDPPSAGQDPPRGGHSAHPDDPDPKDSHAAKPGDPGAKPDPGAKNGDQAKDPKTGDQPKDPNAGPQPKDPKSGDQPKDPNAGGDKPGADNPGNDNPGNDKPGNDKGGHDKPGN